MKSESIINGQKILFVLKETYAYPVWYLLPYFEKKNEVAVFFLNHAESGYKKCIFNQNTYYKFLTIKNLKIYNLNKEADEFTACYKEPVCDIKYLEHIEENICKYKNLNLQAVASQQLSKYYHNRNYFVNYSYEQRLKWIELNYKGIERVIDDFQPTLILDTDTFEFPRTVLAEITNYRNIPYIAIDYPRYEDYKIPTFTVGYGILSYFNLWYQKNMEQSDENLSDEINYVKAFRNKVSIMSKEYEGTVTAQYTADSKVNTVKRLLGNAMYIWNQNISAGNYKKIRSNPLIYPSPKEMMRFFWRTENTKRKLYGVNKYFKQPKKGEAYVYFPLHLIPEASTVIKAPYYVNEMHIIESISKSLPIGWKLYVKEHQSMLGEREVTFYQKVNQLPNCKMVQLDYYKDPKPWMVNSRGVITITGTSAYEAVMLGKRAIVFGDASFNVIEGISRVSSYENLYDIIRSLDAPIDNIKSCAAYIRTVKDMGRRIDIRYLMREGERMISKKELPSEQYIAQIEQLVSFYDDAYSIAEEVKKYDK